MLEFAKLYSAITSIEAQYSLAYLEKEEKQTFVFIVSPFAKDKKVRDPEIVVSEITSRASTYRHINSLKDLNLIEVGRGGKSDTITLSSRFNTFP